MSPKERVVYPPHPDDRVPLTPGTRLLLVEAPLALTLLVGTIGALWVSDDFDEVRFLAMGWIGVPLAVLYYGSRALYPGWHLRLPRLGAAVVTLLFLDFGAGVVPLVNALTVHGPTIKRTVTRGLGVATRDVRRGGLGILFSTRKLKL
jgi:hypothetical protein